MRIPRDDLTFGECEGLCGGMVERVGWDRYCFTCQEEMREEDEAREEAQFAEDVWFYGI